MTTPIAALDWEAIERSLWDRGYARTTALLTPDECRTVAGLYDDDTIFRSHIQMARFRFGEGEYKYFAHPLPALVSSLREGLYPRLVPVANAWMEALGDPARFPGTLAELHAECARHGQRRPTPLLLKYGPGDYNCLHQDLYGDVFFPLQAAVFLDRPGVDYTGGEFLLVEQRPRAQSAGEVIVPGQGEAVIFTTRHRPAKGARGYYRAQVRHGVSRVRSGARHTLGVIFHDAR
ncbi:MAG: 2OG-Fe(II) oxygenase [Vicinamibacterales bacterium]